MDDTAARQATERWFRRRGLPHLIEGYSASGDVFTRAAPFLGLVALLEVLNALNDEWSAWENALAVVGGVGIVVGGFALANEARDLPALRLPDRVGPWELAVFVLVPPLVPLLIGGQVRDALLTMAFNVVLLGLTYVVISYALGPVVRWGVVTTAHQVGDVLNLMVRSLPLMLLLTAFLFLNAEIWQVASDFPLPLYLVAVALLGVVAVVFVVIRLPRQVDELARFDHWSDVVPLVGESPLAGRPPPEGPLPAADLSRRDWLNVGVVLVFSQLVQVVLVAALIGGFYVAFGLLAVREATILQWTELGALDDGEVLARWTWFDAEVVLTRTLLKVAGFLAAFAGLQFTVSALTDALYREEFLSEVLHEVREALAVRLLYLGTVAR
ncbi:MAG TPA: hypothetical protein VK866_02165 [Acidimicrobiales bacterium]|nr:hypothetical protein [Acidimicrobiales bacterium]